MKVAKIDGKIVQVTDVVPVEREHLQRVVDQTEERLKEAKADLAEYDRLYAEGQPIATNPAPAPQVSSTAAAPIAPPAAPAPQNPPTPPAAPVAPAPVAPPVAPAAMPAPAQQVAPSIQ